MPEKYRIAWEKFSTPFRKKKKEDESSSPWDEIENKKYQDDEDDNVGLLAMTPIGPIPIDDEALNKTFNFWIGYTNFNISGDIVNLIKNTPGVESLNIFSRYRMRIGIGKLFNEHDVMSAIGKTVLTHIEKV